MAEAATRQGYDILRLVEPALEDFNEDFNCNYCQSNF